MQTSVPPGNRIGHRRRLGVIGLGAMALTALLRTLPVHAEPARPTVRLATTTSTENTGLLAELLPPFEQRFEVKVDVVAVGSGAALKLAENGDADVVLSHAPELEEKFVAAGHGVNRREVMYNDFVIVGPPSDPAQIAGSKDAADAITKIAATKAPFVSRGDESGTHQKEKSLWQAAALQPSGEWYREAGQGMGQVLVMASETNAYTLSDRGTYLAMRKQLASKVLVEGGARLRNPYVIIAVNPARYQHVRYVMAMALIGWLTSYEGQSIIRNFKVDGEPLFTPLAVP